MERSHSKDLEAKARFSFDDDLRKAHGVICGIDEAGRGPLAGAVYAAAVILPEDVFIEGLDDSKKLSEKKREALFEEITEKAVCWAVGTASAAEIDEINILEAAMLAMKRAVCALTRKPEYAAVDGNRMPELEIPGEAVVKGDSRSASVAAASIIAKVSRDRYMKELDSKYPGYGFSQHKGYGTKLHYEKINELGLCPEHRRSFLKKLEKNK